MNDVSAQTPGKPEKTNTLDNMIQLCPTCHTQAEHDKIEVPKP